MDCAQATAASVAALSATITTFVLLQNASSHFEMLKSERRGTKLCIKFARPEQLADLTQELHGLDTEPLQEFTWPLYIKRFRSRDSLIRISSHPALSSNPERVHDAKRSSDCQYSRSEPQWRDDYQHQRVTSYARAVFLELVVV